MKIIHFIFQKSFACTKLSQFCYRINKSIKRNKNKIGPKDVNHNDKENYPFIGKRIYMLLCMNVCNLKNN